MSKYVVNDSYEVQAFPVGEAIALLKKDEAPAWLMEAVGLQAITVSDVNIKVHGANGGDVSGPDDMIVMGGKIFLKDKAEFNAMFDFSEEPAEDTYQSRVIAEKAALDLKIDALGEFMLTDTFLHLSDASAALIEDQHNVMFEYSRILGERIKLFD